MLIYVFVSLLLSAARALRQFGYCSASVTKNTPDSVIEDILKVSRQSNQENGITGILLFRDDGFLQIIEGEDQALERTIYRITKDSRHKFMTVLYNIEISRRDFEDWSLAYRIPDRSLMLLERINCGNFEGYLEDPTGIVHPLSKNVICILRTFERIM